MRLQENLEEDLHQHPPLLVQLPVEEPQPVPSAAATGRRAGFSSGGSAGEVRGWHAMGAGRGPGTRADLGGAARTGSISCSGRLGRRRDTVCRVEEAAPLLGRGCVAVGSGGWVALGRRAGWGRPCRCRVEDAASLPGAARERTWRRLHW
jgi:hypothetical protein